MYTSKPLSGFSAIFLLLFSFSTSGHAASLGGLELHQLYSWTPIQDQGTATTTLRCGATFTDSSNGIIYKPFEHIVSNERCVWIIGVPGAVGYDINMIHLGSPVNDRSSGVGLEFTGVRHSGNFDHAPLFSAQAPTTTGQFRVENSSAVIVTFYTTNLTVADGKGFILEYNSIFAGNITGSTDSTHYISAPDTYEFKYPEEGNYTSSELAAFVFPPKGNIHTPGHTEHVSFRIYNLEYNCYDSIFLYILNVNASTGGNIWTYTGRICRDTDSLVLPHDDVALALFQSDGGYEAQGFGYSVFSC